MIRQIIKYSLFISFIATVCLWALNKDVSIIGLFLGTVWSCINFYLIEVLLRELLIKKNIFAVSGLIFIKFPLLYWVGYECLSLTKVSPWAILSGLSLIFIVALFRLLIPMQERVV